jgi:hypothetical protein
MAMILGRDKKKFGVCYIYHAEADKFLFQGLALNGVRVGMYIPCNHFQDSLWSHETKQWLLVLAFAGHSPVLLRQTPLEEVEVSAISWITWSQHWRLGLITWSRISSTLTLEGLSMISKTKWMGLNVDSENAERNRDVFVSSLVGDKVHASDKNWEMKRHFNFISCWRQNHHNTFGRSTGKLYTVTESSFNWLDQAVL